MTSTAKNEATKRPQAPDGQHVAICCDVVDLGMIKVTYNNQEKEQHKIRVWFQIGEYDTEGKRYLISRRFTLSLHEKAALRAFLESWRGKPYTEEESKAGIDVELMVGVSALIQSAVNKNDYADITSIMRLPKKMEAIEVEDYLRMKDRPTEGMDATTIGNDPLYDDEGDDSLPF